MPITQIWIHVVWSTKKRKKYLSKSIRQRIFNYIKEISRSKKIHLDHIGGVEDHIHCLISLSFNQNISEVVRLIKGISSSWINQNNLTTERFKWQKGYYAVSVSPSAIKKVRAYIRNQEAHHRRLSTKEEITKLAQKTDKAVKG